MTRDEVAAFAAELTLTAESFGAALSDARVTAYYQALEDVPWEDLQPAMAAARQCERFFPTPSVLRELVEGPLEVEAADAFTDVWAVTASGGHGRNLLDPCAKAVVAALGGWGTFTEAKVSTAGMLSAQFRKLYVQYLKRERVVKAKERSLPAVDPPALGAR